MNMSLKYTIKEKPYKYQDSAGNKQTGVKFELWNNRSGRKVSQHRSREQVECALEQIAQSKKEKRLSRKGR